MVFDLLKRERPTQTAIKNAEISASIPTDRDKAFADRAFLDELESGKLNKPNESKVSMTKDGLTVVRDGVEVQWSDLKYKEKVSYCKDLVRDYKKHESDIRLLLENDPKADAAFILAKELMQNTKFAVAHNSGASLETELICEIARIKDEYMKRLVSRRTGAVNLKNAKPSVTTQEKDTPSEESLNISQLKITEEQEKPAYNRLVTAVPTIDADRYKASSGLLRSLNPFARKELKKSHEAESGTSLDAANSEQSAGLVNPKSVEGLGSRKVKAFTAEEILPERPFTDKKTAIKWVQSIETQDLIANLQSTPLEQQKPELRALAINLGRASALIGDSFKGGDASKVPEMSAISKIGSLQLALDKAGLADEKFHAYVKAGGLSGSDQKLICYLLDAVTFEDKVQRFKGIYAAYHKQLAGEAGSPEVKIAQIQRLKAFSSMLTDITGFVLEGKVDKYIP